MSKFSANNTPPNAKNTRGTLRQLTERFLITPRKYRSLTYL